MQHELRDLVSLTSKTLCEVQELASSLGSTFLQALGSLMPKMKGLAAVSQRLP